MRKLGKVLIIIIIIIIIGVHVKLGKRQFFTQGINKIYTEVLVKLQVFDTPADLLFCCSVFLYLQGLTN
jgi:hypothetical protein